MKIETKIDIASIFFKVLKICIGLFTAGIGIAIMYNVGWGSAPGATLTQGMSVFTGNTYGVSSIIVNLTFLVLLFFLDKSLIGVGTVLVTFFLGFFIDSGMLLVSPLNIDLMSLEMKIVMMIIGSIIISIGFGYYVGVDFGTGALDGIAVALNRKYKVPFTYCRWGSDAALMLIGILLGASWGAGTVSCLVLTGPIMDFVIKKSQSFRAKKIDRLQNESILKTK